jgi:hypothetical protein
MAAASSQLRAPCDRPRAPLSAGPNSNTSQFFITLGRCDWLNKKNTIFAKVGRPAGTYLPLRVMMNAGPGRGKHGVQCASPRGGRDRRRRTASAPCAHSENRGPRAGARRLPCSLTCGPPRADPAQPLPGHRPAGTSRAGSARGREEEAKDQDQGGRQVRPCTLHSSPAAHAAC